MEDQTGERKLAGRACQVVTKENEYQQLIALCKMHKNLYGNVFTYTLLDMRAEKKQLVKKVALFGAAGALVVGLIRNFTKKKRKKAGRGDLAGRRKTKKTKRWKRSGLNF